MKKNLKEKIKLYEGYSEMAPLKSIKEDYATYMAVGAGIGALSGVISSLTNWYNKRMELKDKIKNCNGDPICIDIIKDLMKKNNKMALLNGVTTTAMGAAAGGGVGAGIQYIKSLDTSKKIKDLSDLPSPNKVNQEKNILKVKDDTINSLLVNKYEDKFKK